MTSVRKRSARCRDSAIAGDPTIESGAGDDAIDTLGTNVAGARRRSVSAAARTP